MSEYRIDMMDKLIMDKSFTAKKNGCAVPNSFTGSASTVTDRRFYRGARITGGT
ncbi:hypothetical protein [Pantoea sp. SM3640]|uniref:hypothetical protein n=1 Tax=Pantoea sp. SM3640 TaxID=2787629 RepID=UPI001E4C9CFA|nr:hypothetical protein [Pantoea sp. SM3640]